MNLKSILCISAVSLILSSIPSGVKGGISFGKCPTITSIAYDSSTMSAARDHKLLYIDSMVGKA